MEVSGGSEAGRADSAMPPRDAPWDGGLLCCEARQVRKVPHSESRQRGCSALVRGRDQPSSSPPQKGAVDPNIHTTKETYMRPARHPGRALAAWSVTVDSKLVAAAVAAAAAAAAYLALRPARKPIKIGYWAIRGLGARAHGGRMRGPPCESVGTWCTRPPTDGIVRNGSARSRACEAVAQASALHREPLICDQVSLVPAEST